MADNAALLLEDGSLFYGKSVAGNGVVSGELVFNTSQTGYQEILTDPSYAHQLIVFTQPHIGNVGVNDFDMESEKPYVNAAIMRSFSDHFSNWRAGGGLKSFFARHRILAISNIDTRALTQRIRQYGSQKACVFTEDIPLSTVKASLQSTRNMQGYDLAGSVTTQNTYQLGERSAKYHIVVLDFGVKRSILQSLLQYDCRLTIVPAHTNAKTIATLYPDGIVLSNGPGDPAACSYAVNTVKALLSKQIPIMAICLGHQLLALASGAKTKKMVFGHHGANHPVLDIHNGNVFISSQNHGFVVDEESMPASLSITHRSLFDGSIAGIKRLDVPAFGFQGHPEAGPGPLELTNLFSQFLDMVETRHAKASSY